MENLTLRARIQQLAQKSRKALRLYTSMVRTGSRSGDLSEIQISEWRDVNADLLKQLSFIMDSSSSKKLVAGVFAVRDRFYSEWRTAEADLHNGHKALIHAAEKGDFVKSASLARQLVSIKSRVEAAQAAHQELQDMIDQCRLTPIMIELSDEHVIEEEPQQEVKPQAVVIPLHSKRRRVKNRYLP